jgi:D-alanine-D-alanine ligase
MKKKIILLMGGPSKERSVSILSGKACYKALKKAGYDVVKIDPKNENLNLSKHKANLAFNALHGQFGEDGTIQKILEKQKIPYTHSGIRSSKIAMDKVKSKIYFIKNKILTPKYKIIKKISDLKNNLSTNKFVIKPINEGSSVGVLIYDNYKKINFTKIKYYLNKYKKLLQEEYIPGKEIQVAVMGKKPLGAIEIQPLRKFYDFKAKYSHQAKTKHIMPANINKDLYKKILLIALKAHNVLGCRGVTRSDFRVINKKIYILEVNTQPGMTNLSLVPEIAQYRGITFDKLVKWIAKDASINR